MMVDPKGLLDYLPEQRWFGFKGYALAGIDVVDEIILSDGPPALVIAIVAVNFEGTIVHFQLPLVVDEDGGARDAIYEPERLKLIGELMAQGDSVKGSVGVVHFGGPGLDPLAPPPGSESVRIVGAEQSNSSIVLDEHVILKFFRRLDIGRNPDLELNRMLTSEGFVNVPAQVGEITYNGTIDGDDVEIDLGIAQQFLSDGVDAWEHILVQLARLFDEVDPADTAEDRPFLIEERAGDLLESIAELGDVIASMHVTLSRDESDPAYNPESTTHDDAIELRERTESALAEADAVAELHTRIRNRLNILNEVEDLGARIRVHGDLHLGQVMASSRGWMVLDFEGEPLRSLEERRAKRSPLKDVAGMLRSFNYVAIAALFERCEPGSPTWNGLEPWATAWELLARDRFLTGYLTRAHEGRFLPADRELLGDLIGIFEIEKALYEVAYEQRHRPDWVRIPVYGIKRILGVER